MMNQKFKTMEEIMKDKYKDTITQFLKDTTLYDCLSFNNQVIVLDQSFTCWEVFQIFIETNAEETIFWNQDISNYDGVFTHADLIKVILRLYNNANLIKHNLKLGVIEEEANDDQEKQSHQDYLKQKFFNDLKSLTIKQWFHLVNDELDFSMVNGLVKGRMDERLFDACNRINRSGISRIIVVDPESQMIIGTLHQKDVLVFLIKGFTQYFSEIKKYLGPEQNQHQLKIKQFYKRYEIDNEPIHHEFSCHHSLTTFQVFHSMIHTYKALSMPIVNDQKQFIGLLCRRDIIIIIRNGLFDMLSQPIKVFLDYLQEEKRTIPAYYYLSAIEFNMNQTVKEVVESLVLSENNSLVCLNENKQIVEIISISDIFAFILDE